MSTFENDLGWGADGGDCIPYSAPIPEVLEVSQSAQRNNLRLVDLMYPVSHGFGNSGDLALESTTKTRGAGALG